MKQFTYICLLVSVVESGKQRQCLFTFDQFIHGYSGIDGYLTRGSESPGG